MIPILTNLDFSGVCYAEAKGLSKVWEAYAEFSPQEDILEVGFNENFGNIYIALENGVTIVSTMGNDVHYLIMDEMCDEVEFECYSDAEYEASLLY